MKLLNLTFLFSRGLKKRQADYSFRYFSIKKTSSYVCKNGSLPLSDVTVSDLLDNAANTFGDHTALICEHQGISKNYLDIRNEAEKLASGFLANGLRKGDRIAVYSPNCYEYILTQFAASKAGLILVAINYAYTPQELEYCLKKAGCKAAISFDKLNHQDFYEIFKKIIPNLNESKAGKIHTNKFPGLERIIIMSNDNKEGTIRFKDVLESGNKDSNIALMKIKKTSQCDDPINILFTSGTTSLPKAVILNNHKVVNNLTRFFHRVGYDKMEPVSCCPLPFFHLFGYFLGTVGIAFYKSTTIIPSATYDCVEHLKCIEKYKCNYGYGAPTMLIDLLKKSRELHTDISTLKSIITGSSSVPENLIKDLFSSLKQPNVHVTYGLTESCGALAQLKMGTDCEKTIKGFLEPSELTELKIIDSKGHVVPKNVEGQICSRGYTTFLRYWEDKEKTDEVIDEYNWFHTGDIGIMNDEGWIKIVGRIKDVVIRGGEKIFLPEVENFLNTHPDILEVHACGVPDERLGEELCCWIILKQNKKLTEEDVRQFCKGKISYYKIPRYIMFVEEFPKTAIGKIKRHIMTEISMKKLAL